MTKLIYRNNISEKQNLGYIETKDNQGNDVFLLVNMTYFERISYGNNSETVFFVDIYEIVKHGKRERMKNQYILLTDKKLIWQSKVRDFLQCITYTERSSVTLSKATITECVKVMY